MQSYCNDSESTAPGRCSASVWAPTCCATAVSTRNRGFVECRAQTIDAGGLRALHYSPANVRTGWRSQNLGAVDTSESGCSRNQCRKHILCTGFEVRQKSEYQPRPGSESAGTSLRLLPKVLPTLHGYWSEPPPLLALGISALLGL